MFIPIDEIRILIAGCFACAGAFYAGYWRGRKTERLKTQERLLWRSRLD